MKKFFLGVPATNDELVENMEIVQTAPEPENSILFPDNPQSDQVVENVEIVLTTPELEESVSHTNCEDFQPEEQNDLVSIADPITSYPDAISESTDVCIFCTKARRKVKGKHVPLYSIEKDALMNTLQPYKEFLEESIVYKRLQSSVDIKAHRLCRVEYINSLRIYDNKPRTDYHKKLQYRETAFQEVCSFIDENIVQHKKCFFFLFFM